MLQVEFYALRWETALLRFYLMMALPIIGGFTGQWWIAFLALPVFLSVMAGIKITSKNKSISIQKETPVIKLKERKVNDIPLPKSA